MKIKKLLALVLALTMVLSCVTAFAAMEELTEPYYEVKCQSDFSQFEDEIVGTNLSGASLFNKVNNVYTEGYVKDGDGFYYLTGGENGTTPSEWLVPLGRNTVSESFSGEYVLSFRSKFVNYRYSANTGTVASYLTYDKSDLNKSFFGVKCVYDNPNQTSTTGTATMYFEYRYKDTVNVGYSLGTWTYTSNEWYTYHSVYNFDTRIINVYVYDSKGDEVAHFSHELLSSINGTTIPYKNVTTSSVYVDGTKRGATFVGDFVFAQTLKKPITAKFDSNLVSVTYNGQEVKNGVATPAAYNSDAAFTVAPKGDYEITEIVVDGEPIESKSKVTFEDIREAHEFTVYAKEDDYFTTLYKTDFSDHANSIKATDPVGGDCVGIEGYVKVGTGYAFLECANAAAVAEWLAPLGSNKLSDTFSGEYIIDNKIRFVNYNWYNAEGWVQHHIAYTSDDSGKMGFENHWVSHGGNSTTGTSTVSFRYMFSGVDKMLELGTWDYNSNEVYAYRSVYNLDNKTAELYVLDSEGTQVAYFKHDLLESVDGTVIPYNVVYTSSCFVQSKNRGAVFVGDYALRKTTAKPLTVKYDAEMGSVKSDGAIVENGAKIPVAYNSATAKTFAIEAKEGYEIADVKVNGESKGNLIDSVEFKNIKADQELEVIFAEKAPAAPSVEIYEYKTAKNYAYKVGEVDATSPYTVIMYGKIAGQPENYGFAFSNGDASVKLDAKSIDANGIFAIRVVGGAILPGSYTAVPYWTDGEGEAFAITVAE